MNSSLAIMAIVKIVVFIGFVISTVFATETVQAASEVKLEPQQYTTTAPQCKCKDIDACTEQILSKVDKCKISPKCEKFLTTIGEPNKIRSCLDKEQTEMKKLEDCVKNKVGPLGCTNNEIPVNLTIPLIPVVDAPEVFETEDDETMPEVPMAAPPVELPQGPPELTQFLMCVDQCSMAESLAEHARRKRSPINCAFKLRCALTPPDQKVQDAFIQCEKDLGIEPVQKFKESCQCLKNAGINMQCPN